MTAIYARQSVERKASISIDMQTETCIRLLPPNQAYRVYSDRGFSGTNTHRPAFQQLLEDIKAGEIGEVYVYKLDRISRSLCDFAAMMQMFREHGVTLRSCRESFDTQTEIGVMILNLLMMFAEMEQKTIAGRVRDNYYARAKQQLALGGIAPYGFTYCTVEKGRRPTKALQEIPEEAEIVRRFYTQYGVQGWNIEQIVHHANQNGWKTRRKANWSNSGVLRLLRSPVYVRGSLDVLRYFLRQGAKLVHSPEQYCCGNGCLTFVSGETHIAAGLHQGIIVPALWLAVQQRLDHRGGSKNGGTGMRSWLQGCVICGYCGESCYVRGNGKGDAYIYFVCRGKRMGICYGLQGLRVSRVEREVEKVLMQQAVRVLPYGSVKREEKPDPAALELERIEEKMRKILRKIGENDSWEDLMRQELEMLGRERERLMREIRRQKGSFPQSPEKLWKVWWSSADISQRRQAAGVLVEKVCLWNDRAEVFFR